MKYIIPSPLFFPHHSCLKVALQYNDVYQKKKAMSKELNLMLIFREKYLVCTPPSVFTARMRNSIPHNPDSVLCIKFYLKCCYSI